MDSGDLPPLDERLPANPMVVEPTDRVGSYGGVWRNGLVGPQSFRLDFGIGYENLVRWNLDWTEVIPNVAESFDVSDDATTYTFKLRDGMKWSDGTDFTADDIVFAYNDLALNAEIVPNAPAFLTARGEPATAEKQDAHTVVFTFPSPQALFLDQIADQASNILTRMPLHFLGEYHPDHGADADGAAKADGFSGWIEALQLAYTPQMPWTHPDLPRLHAWVPTNSISDGQRIRLERNPYYWKVDPDGNQLPYLNELDWRIAENAEVLLLNTQQGEIDLIDRVITTTANKPVLAEARESGGYEFFDLTQDKLNTTTILLNLNHQDAAKRELFQNKDFRIGLSHAINREEIITAVHAQQGEPWQPAPLPESALYDEEMGKQFTEYDLAVANQHLDSAGLTERNGDGVRLDPNGEPIAFRILASSQQKPEIVAALELIRNHWAEVGVAMEIHGETDERRAEIVNANEQDALAWDGGGAINPINAPEWHLPALAPGTNFRFAHQWALWLSSDGANENGLEPPQSVKDQYEIFLQLQAEPDSDARAELMRDLLAITKDHFFLIGVSSPLLGYGVVKSNLHNMAEQTFFSGKFPYPGVNNPEQFFIEG